MYPFPARTVGADIIRPQHTDFSEHPVEWYKLPTTVP